jgi:hypothetical protein
LIGERDADTRVTGPDAACARCHRRSGLGSSEGQIIIPPITSRFLFQKRGRDSSEPDLRSASGFVPYRNAYDVASLERAIRDGIDVGGRKLSYLMPRYRLSGTDMTALLGYLKGFATTPTPGVTDDVLHFATVITPDADPRARQAMLDVLNQFVIDKNEFIRGGTRKMKAAGGVQFRVSRRWQLHIWELTGSPDTWRAQLEAKLAVEPVFAEISGIGGSNWAPIHEFCEASHLPCLFPNTDVPGVAEADFYPLYFNKGVLLEAQLFASQVRSSGAGSARSDRIVQIFRKGDMGETAAKALAAEAARAELQVLDVVVDEGEANSHLADALGAVRSNDTVVLWLRTADVTQLPMMPPAAAGIYFSGLMAGLEAAPLPAQWRTRARLSYPFDPPDKRKFRMNYPLAWMKVRHVALADERVQSNTYLACGIIAEQLTSMQDNFDRDYLLERIEDMLSHRVLTGFYPRLGLAPGQRFASKGGYLVRFAESSGTAIVADGDWTVP